MTQTEIAKSEQKSVVKKISRLNRLNSNSLTKQLAEIGIARGTLPFLMEVLCRDGIIQQEITQALSIDPAATARALQQLEKSGFINRRENKDNRRQKCVYSTKKTREIKGKILEILQVHNTKLFDGFTNKEKNDCLNMLDRMIFNMCN
ncbi:MarR family winged helix-turn-helix transcriptional regulator [uncultured Desulfobacter sp.]|uniref:MarR family winged helix-turn-helix transcriptional regulator n=1 Tax=uncultured Desulfobacter sp. TaxID=240139 RepID=UPI0029F53FC0|nr:MarR family winged helix-turn-helix transcriptional regulator [uncultured Desulfobacter sp.]